MAWNGSGTYTRTNGTNSGPTVWADDAGDGTKITASNHDTHDEDLATAINACLTKNNETKPTADFVPNTDNSYDLGSSSAGWLNAYLTGGAVFDERADHTDTPAAGRAEIWVKSDTPNALMFTDDAGTDHFLSSWVGRAIVGTNTIQGPSGFTIAKDSTGTYTLTHGLNTSTNIVASITPLTGGFAVVNDAAAAANTIEVLTYNTSGTLTDMNFHFIIYKWS